MLESLSIRSFRLIASLDLQFQGGLTVLSGETGAGKSVLLEALGLALGERAEAGMVREGEEQAVITAVFVFPPPHPVWEFLQANGLCVSEGDPLLFRRVLKKDGGSRAFFQDQPITLQVLRHIAGYMVDIHGQFDRFLTPADQMELLDRYGACETLKAETAAAYQSWKTAQEAYLQWQQDQGHALQQRAFWSYCLEELNAAAPFLPDEEATLLNTRQRIQQVEKVGLSLQEALQAFEGEAGAHQALSRIQQAASRLFTLLGEETAALKTALERVFAEVEETQTQLGSLQHKLEKDTDLPLENLDNRLYTLRDLAKKHQVSPSKLPLIQEDLQNRLDGLADADLRQGDLIRLTEETWTIYEAKAMALCERRQQAARRLEAKVQEHLPQLKLSQAKCFIRQIPLDRDQAGPNGMHRFVFWAQTNPGAPETPLHQAASGGELSRFLLVLKRILVGCHETGALIFDEVESGTGGAVAGAIGLTLKEISKTTQVVAITHVPQVAVYADHHIKIEKTLTEESTQTHVLPLSPEAHLEEVSRMLSGESITDAARLAAFQLKQAAVGA